jgi:hypothetical protein
VLVGNNNTNGVLRFDGATGAFLGTFIPYGSGGLNNGGPTLRYGMGMTFGPDGHFYVTSALTHQVLKYDGATGAFLGVFVSTASGGLFHPASIQVGPDGNFQVGSSSSPRLAAQDLVKKYHGASGAYLGDVLRLGRGAMTGFAYLNRLPHSS